MVYTKTKKKTDGSYCVLISHVAYQSPSCVGRSIDRCYTDTPRLSLLSMVVIGDSCT